MCWQSRGLTRLLTTKLAALGSLLLLWLVTPSSLYAQVTDMRPANDPASRPASALPSQGRWVPGMTTRLGIKLGGALTSQVGPNVRSQPEVKPLLGAVAGIYQVLPLDKRGRYYLQPELLVSLQGNRLTNPSTAYEAALHHYYVCLPVLLTVAYRHFFLAAGPQVSYLLGVSERYDHQSILVGGTVTYTSTVGYNYSPQGYRRWDAAYVVDIGYRVRGGLRVEARYVGGFINLYTPDSHLLNATPTGQYNQGIQLQLGYSWRR